MIQEKQDCATMSLAQMQLDASCLRCSHTMFIAKGILYDAI